MRQKHVAWFVVASLVGIPATYADVELIAMGTISRTYVVNLSPQGKAEISGNTPGQVANKGMEGLRRNSKVAFGPDVTVVGSNKINNLNIVARPEGFKPPTLGSEDRCSIR
jgi:hypothetical protein